MTRTQTAAVAVAVAILLAGGAFYAGRLSGERAQATPTAGAPVPTSGSERKILYWRDPMVPGPRFDKPGKSPFMDMPLVPVYADEETQAGIQVSPQVQQNLGIRTAAVTRAQLASSFDAVGTVQFDDRLTEAVQTRVSGYVERLLVRAPMEYVRRGQGLATIYAPDWLGPQNEYFALKRSGAAPELVAAARERLRALSIPDALLRESERLGSAQARFTVSAPVGGVIAELGVREGVAVNPGTTLFRIAGLEKVWAVAEIPESHAVRLTRGQRVTAALQADGARTFEGELKEILPQVNAATRTLQARFEVANRGGRLLPGMLLRLQVAGPSSARLVVPAEAVIRTGARAVVIVRRQDGAFEPRDVQLGADFGDKIEVASGLDEGEQVVASGQFLIDSEAYLKSALGAMATASPAVPAASASGHASSAAPAVFKGQGKVQSVDAQTITISHGAIPELKWPGMTMGFGKHDAKDFPDIRPGDTVQFEFREGGATGYELVSVRRLGGAK